MNTRKLKAEERQVVERFAAHLPSVEGDKLRADIAEALVRDGSDNARIMFEIQGYQRPTYRGQHPFSVEGRVTDVDGADLSVLLHADENGRLLELEIVRFDDGDVMAPDWRTLQLR